MLQITLITMFSQSSIASLQYHDPVHIFSDPINHYSLIHFVEYGILSLLPMIKTLYMWSISLGWELLELFLPYNWARESWLNKLFDLLFNWLGFNSVRVYFRRTSK